MEIRNALQKIENYLTVVSNLNRTILSEGTMSRDELLLMKKYLYTSIDRIEDIEKSLIIDKSEAKSFTPNQMEQVPLPTTAKQKEIVEVNEVPNLEEIEAELDKQEEVLQDDQEEIIAETEMEQRTLIGNIIESLSQEVEGKNINDAFADESVETNMEKVAFVECIIREDLVMDETEEVQPEVVTPVESIITEDLVMDKIEETKIDVVNPVESIITEDLVMDKVQDSNITSLNADNIDKKVELVVDMIEEKIIDFNEEVKNIESQETPKSPLVTDELTNDNNELVASEYKPAAIDFSDANNETELAKNIDDGKKKTLVDELSSVKREEKLLFEQLEEKLNTVKQSQLFHKFNEEEVEDLNKKFASSEPSDSSPITESKSSVNNNENDSELVSNKKVESSPMSSSGLSTAFQPQFMTDVHKTLSESISLNDKFIFVRELFGNNFSDYENALKQIEHLDSLESAESFCETNFSTKFKWNERQTAVERFMELLQNRYESV